MNTENPCAGRGLPGWIVAVVIFASGIVIGRTLAQITAKLGLF